MSTSESDYHIPECRSFWNTATHDNFPASNLNSSHEDLRHSDFERARVHPKFLHSNATSHKWAFGAIAELLDNAVDEISNGATFVKVDRYFNKKYVRSPILLFQDDGGGMSPDGIRNCMSLGFSSKRSSNMIGQYGNGFKTSTMRLGADVIVFSCNNNLGGGRATQSIGLLSYTFLTRTMKNDIIVPMLDFEIVDGKAIPTIFCSQSDWDFNLKLILEWSPFSSMEDLLMQFKDIGLQGTKVFIYNLWCNNDGLLELDFEEDNEDIRLRDRLKAGGCHNEQIQSHISYTFSYSIRDYISILYLKKLRNFSIILRGRPVEQLNISAEMKFSKVVKYRPHVGKDNFVNVNIGFTKEAPLLGTYGLNVYHKNRLIKPFWKVHEEHGVRGKCVIGTLEVNFIEPAHDKQDFERSPLYNRLATRLKNIVLEYWNLHCHLIGYQSKCKSRIEESQKASQVNISVDEASCSLDIPVIPVIELNTTSHQLERPLPSLIGPAPHLPSNFHNNFHPTCIAATTESRCELEDGNIDTCEFSDPMSLEKLREENILLFAKREELRKRKAELKQEMEELQRDLAETKQDIEARRKVIKSNACSDSLQ